MAIAGSFRVFIAVLRWNDPFPRATRRASHTTELAEKWGRRVRNLIAQHGATLGLRLADDNHAAGRWELDNGGEYYAAGVGTGIAGFRTEAPQPPELVSRRSPRTVAVIIEPPALIPKA